MSTRHGALSVRGWSILALPMYQGKHLWLFMSTMHMNMHYSPTLLGRLILCMLSTFVTRASIFGRFVWRFVAAITRTVRVAALFVCAVSALWHCSLFLQTAYCHAGTSVSSSGNKAGFCTYEFTYREQIYTNRPQIISSSTRDQVFHETSTKVLEK